MVHGQYLMHISDMISDNFEDFLNSANYERFFNKIGENSR